MHTAIENIIYGILEYIQLDNSNIYDLVYFGSEILKKNQTNSTNAVYYLILSDIDATKCKVDDPNAETYSSLIASSLVIYRIKSYASQFIRIVDFKDSHSGKYTLQDIKILNSYIYEILKERFKMLNQKADRKYIDLLLDYICASNYDLREILFKCIQNEYVEI